MTEDIMNEIENHMVLPYADDEPIAEPEEAPFERDTSLVDTLRDIARLSHQNDILDNLHTGLCEGMYRKRQAD